MAADLTPLDCSRESTFRSLASVTTSSIEFVNNSNQRVKVYWLDFNGSRVFYQALNARESYLQSTYLTHPWIVTDNSDRCLGIYMPEGSLSRAVVGGCTPSSTNLCLSANRFKVDVTWRAVHLGTSGVGQAAGVTTDTGYFWFFNSANLELVIKVLDGRPVNGRFWVFYGALSNVEYRITVTDTETGAVKTYFNPQDQLASVADTAAF